jgi:hypothetical protein
MSLLKKQRPCRIQKGATFPFGSVKLGFSRRSRRIFRARAHLAHLRVRAKRAHVVLSLREDVPPLSFVLAHASGFDIGDFTMLRLPLLSLGLVLLSATSALFGDEPVKPLKLGIIGLDTSHAVAFTKLLNEKEPAEDIANCRVVAAYPKGSPDIASSVERVPKYTEEVQALGVEIVDSIEELVKRVDCVLLETNDGRPHFEQVLPVLRAKKPCFIDKPVAGSLVDAVAIYLAAEKFGTPIFTSSSLRYTEGAQKLRSGSFGEVFGCDAYSPCSLEKTHPDLFWYGIHGVESLFTVMGTGCESVSRIRSPSAEIAVGVWKDGRIGTFRGIHQGSTGYGGTAFTTKGIQQIGPYAGYRPLVVEIVKFFRTGKPPVSAEESLQIYAFMEAADESKRQDGKAVKLQEVLDKAKQEAEKKVKGL